MEKTAISDTLLVHSRVEEHKQSETGYESLAVTTPEDTQSLSVLVEGVTCALCIQKIESALSAQNDVQAVNLNFGAKRLYIEWSGKKEHANDFVRVVEKLGYGVRPYDEKAANISKKNEERFLLLCLGIAGFATGNVMLLSIGVWITTAETMGMATRDFLHWISAAIALPALLFSARPFFRSALKALEAKRTNMDVPISIAIILASGMSLHETINHAEHVYFDSALMLTFFLLIGRYLDFKARENARSNAHDLLQSFQGFASVLDNTGNIKRILIRDVKENMIVRVAAGEKFPVDGIVIEGESSVDTSLVTGETLPRDILEAAEVFAGTLNINAPVTIRVSKAADHSLLADIVRLMDKAGQAQAAYVRIADKAARLYTPVVHSMAAITFAGWLLIGGIAWQQALMIAVTVLIITCPCALGLAVPVVQVLATSLLMKRGIFVKSGDALERLAEIDTAVFDKTGTLTTGELTLCGEYEEKDIKLAASLASHSLHPLSKAVTQSYKGTVIDLRNIEEITGKGMIADYNEKTIKLGSRKWCGNHNTDESGLIELWLNINDERKICFQFSDILRADAPGVVQEMQNRYIQCIIASGDRTEIVDDIAAEINIKQKHAELSPTQKFDLIEKLKNDGHRVLMIGDGLNDAPVLAGAHVSLAPGTAVDMAQNAADIVFMGRNLSPVMDSYKIAQKTQTLVKQNFALAVCYNMIAIPLAVTGFVTPFIAAIAMSGSSLLVIANSFRLKLNS